MPANLVAFAASGAGTNGTEGGQSVYDQIKIIGFGYGLFQPDNNGGILSPYTRTVWRNLECKFCKNPIWLGTGANGIDDAVIQQLYFTRNFGKTMFKASDLVVNNFFNFGLSDSDFEPETVSTTAGNTTITFSASITSQFSVNDVIAINDAGQNRNGDTNVHVSAIQSIINGTQVQLREAPRRTASGTTWLYNPPEIILANFGLNVQRLYFEGYHGNAIRIGNVSFLRSQTVKISAGLFSSRFGAPIILDNDDGDVDIGLHWTASTTNFTRAIVYASLINGAKRSITIRTPYAADAVTKYLFIEWGARAPDLSFTFTDAVGAC